MFKASFLMMLPFPTLTQATMSNEHHQIHGTLAPAPLEPHGWSSDVWTVVAYAGRLLAVNEKYFVELITRKS